MITSPLAQDLDYLVNSPAAPDDWAHVAVGLATSASQSGGADASEYPTDELTTGARAD